jgi:Heavy metal binding domain
MTLCRADAPRPRCRQAPARSPAQPDPEVTSEQPGRCPKCGMKLLASRTSGQPEGDHGDMAMHHDDAAMHHGTAHDAQGAAVGAADGVEWEHDMVEVRGSVQLRSVVAAGTVTQAASFVCVRLFGRSKALQASAQIPQGCAYRQQESGSQIGS